MALHRAQQTSRTDRPGRGEDPSVRQQARRIEQRLLLAATGCAVLFAAACALTQPGGMALHVVAGGLAVLAVVAGALAFYLSGVADRIALPTGDPVTGASAGFIRGWAERRAGRVFADAVIADLHQ